MKGRNTSNLLNQRNELIFKCHHKIDINTDICEMTLGYIYIYINKIKYPSPKIIYIYVWI